MRKTKTNETDNKMAVNVETLAEMLDCGKPTAMRVGAEAGARVQIGKRVLYKVDRINQYLDRLIEEGSRQEEAEG